MTTIRARLVPTRTLNTDSPGVLKILAVPFGSRDYYGTFFSEKTDFMESFLALPPSFYWHGAATKSLTDTIATTLRRWKDEAGLWFEVLLDLTIPEALRVWNAAQEGNAYASTGAIPASIKVAPNGEVLKWFIGDLSIFDLDVENGRIPANYEAVAVPSTEAIRAVLNESARMLFDNAFLDTGTNSSPGMTEIENAEEILDEQEGATMTIEELASMIQSVQEQMNSMRAQFTSAIRSLPCPCGSQRSEDGTCNCDQTNDESTEVQTMRSQIVQLQTDLAAQTHGAWFSNQVAAGRLTPAEREPVLQALRAVFLADPSGAAVNAMLSAFEARPVNSSIVASLNTGSSLRAAGFDSVLSQETIDQNYMNVLRQYAALSQPVAR